MKRAITSMTSTLTLIEQFVTIGVITLFAAFVFPDLGAKLDGAGYEG